MKVRKSSVAFFFKDNLFIASKKKSNSGLEFVKEPIFKFSIDEDVSEIGTKIIDAISFFEVGADDLKRDEFKAVFEPILKIVNCKSYNTFWKTAKHVPIVLEIGIITFYATENFGPKGGYSGRVMPKIDLDVENASASDLGTALLKAFELSSIVVQDKPNV